eukprot:1621897-Rhodomonas_salina.2
MLLPGSGAEAWLTPSVCSLPRPVSAYAMSGTDLAYAAPSAYAMSGTDVTYGARCPGGKTDIFGRDFTPELASECQVRGRKGTRLNQIQKKGRFQCTFCQILFDFKTDLKGASYACAMRCPVLTWRMPGGREGG